MDKSKKYNTIAFRVPQDDKETISKIAEKEFHTVSQWVYKIVKSELNKRKRKK